MDRQTINPSNDRTVFFYFFYFFSAFDCMDCLRQASRRTHPISPVNLSIKSKMYEKYDDPTDEDIRIVRTSLNIIFSNYCPGYLEAKMLDKIDANITPSLYFYSVFSNVSSLKHVEVTDNISKTFIDIIACVLECIEQKELKKWKEIFIYYKLHNFDDEDFCLLGEILFLTLCTVLIESEKSDVILSWKKVFWGILWRAKCYSNEHCSTGSSSMAAGGAKRVKFGETRESTQNTQFYGTTT